MMITNPDGHGRRCPVCDERIHDDRDCARCAKPPDSRSEPKEAPTAHSRWINETLDSFRFTSEELAEFSPHVLMEIQRQMPDLVKRAALAGFLPALLQRGRSFYLSKGVAFDDALELEGQLAQRVLAALSKGAPRANAGAWIAAIQRSVLMDFLRAKYREKKRFGIRQDVDSLAGHHDNSHDEEWLRLRLEELPVASRKIIERVLDGQEWEAIAADAEKTVDELKESVHSMIWPEGSAPLRKKRRRRRPDS